MSIMALLGGYDGAEDVLDAIALSADQHCPVVLCSIGAPMVSPHAFVASEYNRSGDAYRCPKCHQFVCLTEDGESSASVHEPLPFPPSSIQRQIEVTAASLFGEYAKLYYGPSCVTSVYAWDASPSAVFSELGVAVFFHHRPDKHVKSVWNSTHIISLNLERDDTILYSMQTTIFLDVSRGEYSSEVPVAPTQSRVNGFVSSPIVSFKGKKGSRPGKLDPSSIAADIGEQIQTVENKLRESLEELYFGKTTLIVKELRRNNAKDSGAGLHRDPENPGERTRTPWEACTDTEGNKYYYNSETGETSWDPPPPVGLAPEATTAIDSTECEPSAGKRNAVLEVLESLGLSQPDTAFKAIKKYFKSYGLKLTMNTFATLMDDDQVVVGPDGETQTALEVLIPAFGDRRKITKYISKVLRTASS